MPTVERVWDGRIALVPVGVLANAKISREARLLYAMACGMNTYPGDKEVSASLGVRASSLSKFWQELVDAELAQLVGPMLPGDGDVRSYVLGGTFWDAPGQVPEAAPAAPRTRSVAGVACSGSEELIAETILAHFNERAGTRYTLNVDHRRMLVMRMRAYPDVDISEHIAIVDAFFTGDKWWDGRPSLNLIYGNDGQFERCRERAHGGTGRGGSLSASDMLRAAQEVRLIESGE